MVSVTREVTDAQLIAAAQHDGTAFAELYDRHVGRLYRYACRRVGKETAEDVVAETFLAAFRALERYDTDRPDAGAWLFAIVTKELAKHHRTERARYRALAKAPAEPTDAGFDERVDGYVSAAAAGRQLAAAMARLAARDRDTLLLVAWGELSYEDVARVLSVPVGTVRSRLNRARRKMRGMLKDIDMEVAL
ncbi:RNA polymerase sigma factor [Phytohabitans rumicis]|uniref:DNA-directed RNA polymerase sigma-70 factor n=1 Tax=Phytohabitans rumicis TaxID=1076125 RepID=A0A6V8LLW4_9ACTN|nr:RNA polymerase sigma factor [Phytohabitans rumicis]GFJ93625.1 DNA-directed RNA polymerase sigma-70 factor [Phytohabitans rumicis]